MHSETAALLDYLDATAPVLVLRLDAQQRVLTANAHAQQVLGTALAGRTLRDLVVSFTPLPDLAGADATQATRTSGHLLSLNIPGNLPESYRFRFTALPDGWLALGSIDAEEQRRLRAEVLELNRDLNDLTRQLHLANAELRELNQLKNHFLGMAAHDLRRPISLIMTYSQFVIDEATEALSAEHRDFLRTSLQAATDMKHLIDNFLDVAIIESGALHLDLAPASVPEILSGVEPIARLIAAKKNIDLRIEVADNERKQPLDAARMQQVLLNLIGNAVEHSQPGQRVWLTAGWDATGLVFTVRDEGPGIAAADQAHLFKAFARAGTRKTAGERSVGLGLSIARLVVEAHGGHIGVESVPGHGATFRVILPPPTTSSTQTQAIS